MMARWLAETCTEVNETTSGLNELHCRTHLAPHFATLESITTAMIATYGRNRVGVRRRGRATELSMEEARALISELPAWSNPRNAPRFPVRARFVTAHETSLRPSTLNLLSVPEHYTPGDSALRLTADIDKARFARDVPLSAEAMAALESVAPKSGLIFGEHDYRDILKKAARKVLSPEKAATSRRTTSATAA